MQLSNNLNLLLLIQIQKGLGVNVLVLDVLGLLELEPNMMGLSGYILDLYLFC
jgi:hypothetical protein